MIDIPPGSSLDHAGIDRRTYEDPCCGNTAAHGQHFHSPIGGLRLNCPGSFGPGVQAAMTEARHIMRDYAGARVTGEADVMQEDRRKLDSLIARLMGVDL